MAGNRMSRRSLFISLGIIFAFGVCAINFAILARRTVASSSKSSSSSISSSNRHWNATYSELALDLPVKLEEHEYRHNYGNHSKSGNGSELTLELPMKEEEIHAVGERNNAQSDVNDKSTSIDSCFRARKDTIPPEMYGNLSLPFINLGKKDLHQHTNSFWLISMTNSQHCFQLISHA